jgi:murein DD-endopeptidase MepM/ murein hydrolase activator NlpD
MRLVVRLLILMTWCVGVFVFVPQHVYAAPPQDSPVTYVVQSGDTLFGIATRFQTTVAVLKQTNNLTSDVITVGQKLIVPSAGTSSSPAPAPTPALPNSTISYIVQSGDTLYRIALKYGTTMRVLQNLNDLPSPDLIAPGQAVAIPNISPSGAKPGLAVDPASVRQGGTFTVQVARPEAVQVTGNFDGKPIPFIRASGYYYALVGVSRCGKITSAPLTVTSFDALGHDTTDKITVNLAATTYPVDAITLPPSKVTILQNTTLVNTEAVDLAKIVAKHTPTRLWNGAFRLPITATISEYFGTRRSYNGGPVGACGHEGTDFSAPQGTPIYAPARGIIVFAGLTQVRGNMVVVDHGVGVFSAYYHMVEINTSAGQAVEPGTLIGKVGTTGLSTGPHLHWSMWVNGEYVDPLEWTKRSIP